MLKRITIIIINIFTLIIFSHIQVYADTTVNLLEIKNYDIDISSQYSIKPIYNLTSAALNSSYETEIYIIKNGLCVAYLPFDSTYTGTNSDTFLKPDGSLYTDNINFYLQDMDYSVFVYKYTLEGDNIIDQTTTITKEDAFDTTNIEYSINNIVNKNFNNNSINEDFTCFYTGDSGKTLYIQFVNEFPDVTIVNNLNANFTFDFNTLEGHLTLTDNFEVEGAVGFLGNESSLIYYLELMNGDSYNEQLPLYLADLVEYNPIDIGDIDLDSINRIWVTFAIIPLSPEYCVGDNATFVINGNTFNDPIPVLTDQLYAFTADELADPSVYSIDNNPNKNGYYYNALDENNLYFQVCIEKGDTPIVNPPSPNTNTTDSSSGHIVLNTGVTK